MTLPARFFKYMVLVLVGSMLLLLVTGIWLYQFERRILLERELRQEQMRLVALAGEMEFMLMQASQNGQYLATLLAKPAQENAVQKEGRQVAIQYFMHSHPAFYRISLVAPEGDIMLDTLNLAVPDSRNYAAFRPDNIYPGLRSHVNAYQERVLDLGIHKKTGEHMLALLYPVTYSADTRSELLIILTSINALLPDMLLAGQLAQHRMSIITAQQTVLSGESPEPAFLQALKNHRHASEASLPTIAADYRYQLVPVHLSGLGQDWLLIKKYVIQPNNQSIQVMFWWLGISALLLISGFFAVTCYFLSARFGRVEAGEGEDTDILPHVSAEDIADERVARQMLVAANQALHRLAHIDALTGLSNRRAFDFALAREWQKAIKYREPVSLIMIDVDYFKAFNDHYGHKAGDICLQRIAQVLRMEVQRMNDVVARYGGEEFCLILPNTPLANATKIAWNIRQRVIDMGIPHEDSRVVNIVTVSCGVACLWPYQGSHADELLHLADQAMYRAKNAGRNTVES